MPSKRQRMKAKKRYTEYFLREKITGRQLTYFDYMSYFESLNFETTHERWVHHNEFTTLLDKYIQGRF